MNFSRFYTVEEVNQMIPGLRLQIENLQQLRKEHAEKRDRLQELKIAMYKNVSPNHTVSDEDPFFALECEMEFLEFQAKQILLTFQERDILIKSIDAGLVDFPAKMNGEIVLLCWLKDEQSCRHYHGMNDGFWGRRKLDEE